MLHYRVMAETKIEKSVRIVAKVPKVVVDNIDSAASETQRDRSKMVASILVDWNSGTFEPKRKLKTT